MSTNVRIGVLGPLRLQVDGADVDVPGPKRRAVLAMLALHAGHVVSVDALVDALWPSGAPATARATLHSHVSRLRRHLGPHAALLKGTPGGYRLAVDPSAVDESAARAALAPDATLDQVRCAWGLWRGPALAGLADDGELAAWAASLDALRPAVGDRLVALAIANGSPDDAAAVASELVALDPLREASVVGLMRALAACGRHPEALGAAHDFRGRLAEASGMDATARLDDAEREIASSAPVRRRVGTPSTPLAGREAELAALRRLIDSERLVTVVGPGGVGKTRLAVESARRATDATMLRLAAVADDAGIAHALAAELDLRVGHDDVLAACAALLEPGAHLLVVDNCEHLAAGVRPVVQTLLACCPHLHVLATSREPLGIEGECLLRLDPLAVPPPGAARPGDAPAVAMFVDRARRARAGFAPTPADLDAAARIVRSLDGLPLAIELAAARLHSMALEDLDARAGRWLDMLASPAAEQRHRTLRATVEWSYGLLPPHQQRLFRFLSVFPDGFDLATAESVGTGLGGAGHAVTHLAEASMVTADLGARPARYRMLHTLRAYAADRLDAADESRQAREVLVSWATGLCAWIGETARTDREALADAALRRELGNLRAAWSAVRAGGGVDAAAGIITSLSGVGGNRDVTELWAWSGELAADPALRGHPLEAEVLGIAACEQWMRGDHVATRRLADASAACAADDEQRHWSHAAFAMLALSAGRFDEAVTHGLAAARLGGRPTDWPALSAMAACYAGRLDRAREVARDMLAVVEAPSARALAEYALGETESAAGDAQLAAGHYARATDLARSVGATFVAGVTSVGLLTLYERAGRTTEALRGYAEVVAYWRRAGNWTPMWTTLRNLARVLASAGAPEDALFLLSAAEAAPEASAPGGDVVTDRLAPAAARRVRTEAQGASRDAVVERALRAIDDAIARG